MNNQITLKELEDTKTFYKFFNKSNEELIYHNSQTKEPVYKQQNYIDKYNLKDLQNIILEDLKKHNYIAIKKIGDYSSSITTDSYNNALLFISDSNLNNYQFNFYKDTIRLLENQKHPLQISHVPYLYYEINSRYIYKGLSHFTIAYKNIENNNNCQCYLINSMCLEHNIFFKEKPYEIIILSKQDVIKNVDIYDAIIPVNKTEYKNPSDIKKINNIDFEKNTILENDGPEIKTIKILKNYFYSVFTNTEYIPDKFAQTEEFTSFVKEHAALFIRLINNVSFDIFGEIKLINEN